jgi:hypothetical protein
MKTRYLHYSLHPSVDVTLNISHIVDTVLRSQQQPHSIAGYAHPIPLFLSSPLRLLFHRRMEVQVLYDAFYSREKYM